MIQGNILGTFAEIVYEMNEMDLLAQEKADNSVAAMKVLENIEPSTKNIAINYVKTVSIESYFQDQFTIFQTQCSPNLMNKINRHLLQIFVKMASQDKDLKSIFDGRDMAIKPCLLNEIIEFSKLLVLQDKSIQSIICNEGDDCNGLFIVQKGTIGGWILNRSKQKIPLRESTESCLVGEVAFFMKTKRTATVMCKTSARIFFLDFRYKQTLLELCPMLYKRMRSQVYRYEDEVLEYKIRLLRLSVYYFEKAEREALVELSFQSKVEVYQKDILLKKQLSKIDELLIVADGILMAQLPVLDLNSSFERFTAGSSYGLNSVLKHEEPCMGLSRFKIVTKRLSHVIHIKPKLLFSLTEKFKQLDKLIAQAIQFIELKGIPLCDFQISQEFKTEAIIQLKEKAMIEARNKRIEKEKNEQLKFFSML